MCITLESNLSRVVEALEYKDVAIFLTISTVSTFFERVLGGSLSEFLIKLDAIPRPFLDVILQGIVVANYVRPWDSLDLFSLEFFFTAGVQMTMAVRTASEFFGLKYVQFFLLVYPLAGNFFCGFLVKKLYDYEAHKVGATTHMGSTSSSRWQQSALSA